MGTATIRRFIGAAAALLAALQGGQAANAAPPPVNVADYRQLDDRQLGYLDWIITVANRPGGDWSEMGSFEPGQGGFDSYRYQLAMLSYALDLVNYHYTPAYRDLDQDTSAKLIDKMLREDVWGFWQQTSRGSVMFDPDLKVLGEGWIDPVREQNIMYSGHLMQMVATHAMLYGDDRYEKPDGIRLVYDPVGQGLGRQVFTYSTRSLADNLYKQFERSGWRGIECEPNAIFPECNQHPILGFAAMEGRIPTGYFATVSTRFRAQFDAMKYVDPATGSFMEAYLKRQNKVSYDALPWSDGWSGAFMHAWAKADVEALYPIQRERYLAPLPDGTLTVRAEKPSRSYSHDHGFFAVLAAEVGDVATQRGMLAYADKYWRPRWDEAGLRYPRRDDFRSRGDPANVWRRVQVLTGNSLMALAALNVKDGLYTLYSRPRVSEALLEPFISNVDYPSLKVKCAVYDSTKKALIVSLRRGNTGAPDSGDGGFTVRNLAADRSYAVWRNDKEIARIRGDRVEIAASAREKIVFQEKNVLRLVSIEADASYVFAELAVAKP